MIIYQRLDKVVLLQGKENCEGHSSKIIIQGLVTKNLMLKTIAYDDLALALNSYISEKRPINKLRIKGELVEDDLNGQYWFAHDAVQTNKVKGQNTLIGDPKTLIKKLLNLFKTEKKVPLVFYFSHKLKIEHLMSKADFELITSCSYRYRGDGSLQLYLVPKINSKQLFPISAIPTNSCNFIEVHPEFNLLQNIPDGPFQTKEDFENAIKELLELDQRKILLFEFTNKTYVPEYEMEPTDYIKVECINREISYNNGRTFVERVNLFVKPGARRFYYPENIPFSKVSQISIFAEENEPYYLETHVLGKKTRLQIKKSTKKEEELQIAGVNWLNLQSLLVRIKSKKRVRSEDGCLLCGRPITNENPYYTNLTSNGYLVDTPSTKNINHFGFFKVGPECSKHLEDSYLFSFEDISSETKYQSIT